MNTKDPSLPPNVVMAALAKKSADRAALAAQEATAAREEAQAAHKALADIPVVQGPPGEQGPAGRDGIDGKDGRDGIDGKDGRDGVDGKDGEPGPAGPAGPRGARGPAGSAPVLVNPEFETLGVRGEARFRTVKASGALNAASVATTGAITAGSVASAGAITANSVTSTGTLSGVSLSIGGEGIAADNVQVSSGNIIIPDTKGIQFSTPPMFVSAVPAKGRINRTGTNVSDGDTVTLHTITYTFKTTLTPANYEVRIGATANDSAINLVRAVNNSGGTPGTDYVVPAANPKVTGANEPSSMLFTAKIAGASENTVAMAASSAQLTALTDTLRDGVNAWNSFTTGNRLLDYYEKGVISPYYITGVSNAAYSNANTHGAYTRIGRVVTVRMSLFVTACTREATDVILAGLPYAPATSVAAGLSAMTFGYADCFAATPYATTLVGGGFSLPWIALYKQDGTALQGTDIANDIHSFQLSGSYFATL